VGNYERENRFGFVERRLAIYDAVRDIVGEITRTGAAPDPLYKRYCLAMDLAPYFFGKDVHDYLETIRMLILDLDLSNTMMGTNDANHARWAQKRSQQFLAITDFYKAAPPIFEPYIRAHQKAA
jgi:hypothetical protein